MLPLDMRGLVYWNLVAACAFGRDPLPAPEFEINLDLDPEDRFTEVVAHFSQPLHEFFDTYANSSVVLDLAKQVSEHRGPENDELQGEINGIAKASGIPDFAIHAVQLLYELQTLMVPFNNITWPWGESTAFNALMHQLDLVSLFGCTGIVARNAEDGTVYHARNQDFSFAKYMQNMTYVGVYTKGGQTLFRAQQIAAYSAVLTGVRMGPNGYAIEQNTRYLDHKGGNSEMFKHLFTDKRITSGWTKRKVLETIDNFEDAVEAFSTTPYAATEYNIMSGVQKGTILARNPDGLAYTLDLSDDTPYIIMTNFDYVYHDKKEWLDPSGVKGIGHSRRVGAEKILNKTLAAGGALTPELLYAVINDDGVMAKDTIFQAIINVEKGLWNATLPFCESCDGCEDVGDCRSKEGTCCSVREHFTLSCGGAAGGYRCGCLADGVCRSPRANFNMTQGDEDCCSFESHFTLACPSTRRCGPSPTVV